MSKFLLNSFMMQNKFLTKSQKLDNMGGRGGGCFYANLSFTAETR